MSIITVIAAAALAALLVWKIGAPIARFGGALMVVSSLAFIVMGDPIAVRAPWLVAGTAIWLAGHFLAAYQHRFWRSRLAENIVVHTPLRYIDPVNGHEYREARREKRAARTERPTREDAAPAKAAPVDHFAEWERELTDDDAPATEAPAKAKAPAKPKAKAPARRSAPKPAPAKAAGTSRGVVYGKRAAKAAGNLASRTVPGARAARSAWRFIR